LDFAWTTNTTNHLADDDVDRSSASVVRSMLVVKSGCECTMTDTHYSYQHLQSGRKSLWKLAYLGNILKPPTNFRQRTPLAATHLVRKLTCISKVIYKCRSSRTINSPSVTLTIIKPDTPFCTDVIDAMSKSADWHLNFGVDGHAINARLATVS
jgi:hypothetical protein